MTVHITDEEWDVIRDGLDGAHAAVKELFVELGNKRAAQWGIINDGLMDKDRARTTFAECTLRNETRVQKG